MKRRAMLKAGLSLPFLPLLQACGKNSPIELTGFLQNGMYLSDNFAPVEQEFTSTKLRVSGQIPPELTGRYLRNGPNPITRVDPDVYHWFMGDGMVHGIRLENGRADWYRNRYVRSDRVAKSLGDSKSPGVTFSANTNIIGHGGRTWAIVESGGHPVELDYELNTVGLDPGWGEYTAHPKLDPDTGELHAIAYNWASYRNHVKYIVMDKNARRVKSMDIPLPGMTMIHDMALTKNYAVILDLPVTVSFKALALGADFPFRWDADHEPRVGLLPRNGSAADIIWSPVTPNYSYHPMNAYEDERGHVVIDICRYERMFDVDTNGPFGDSSPRLDRWTINPQARTVSEQTIDERAQEFPRCHPDLNTKPYRYGYVLAVDRQAFPGIYKHDLQTGSVSRYEFGPGRHGGEAIFVPRKNSRAEDDGFLMTLVYDEGNQVSELLILDAQDFAAPPIATVYLPARVPYGFHGNWLPDSQMEGIRL